MLILITGLPGTGKTTVAKKIAKKMNGIFFEIDIIKHKLLPQIIGKEKWNWYKKHQKPYPQPVRVKIYQKMCLEVEKLLKSNKDVIVEATFSTKELRQMMYSTANSLGVKFHVIEVNCPENIVKERMEKRYKEIRHPARFGIYKQIKKIWEPIEREHYLIDSSKNIDKQIVNFIKALK